MSATVVSILLMAAAAGVAAFVGLYSWYTPWWRNETGRWLVTFPSLVGLLCANGVVFRLFGDYPHRDTVSTILLAATVVSIWWRLVLLIHVIRRYPKKDRPSSTPPPPIGGP